MLQSQRVGNGSSNRGRDAVARDDGKAVVPRRPVGLKVPRLRGFSQFTKNGDVSRTSRGVEGTIHSQCSLGLPRQRRLISVGKRGCVSRGHVKSQRDAIKLVL